MSISSCSCVTARSAPRGRVTSTSSWRSPIAPAPSPALIRDGVPALREVCEPGRAVRVVGAYSVHPRYGPQLAVRAAARRRAARGRPRRAVRRPAALGRADGGRPARDPRHHPEPPPARAARRDLRPAHAHVGAVPRRPGRQALPPGLPPRPARAQPVGRASVSAISANFPGIDREVAVTGALLHDIGKLDAYASTGAAIDLTDVGKLQGEIPLGYYRIRRLIEDLPDFPERARRRRAAHHPQPPRPARARLAGRPVHARGHARPHDRQPRRAARLVRPAREELPQGSRWSAFDRALGGGAYFADRQAA